MTLECAALKHTQNIYLCISVLGKDYTIKRIKMKS